MRPEVQAAGSLVNGGVAGAATLLVKDIEPVGGGDQGEGDEQDEENAEGDQNPEADSLRDRAWWLIYGTQVLPVVEAPTPEMRVELPL
jgi:hypothetical protein